MQYDDNIIYGETASPDCPQDGNGGFCFKNSKMGLMIGSATQGGKSLHNPSLSGRPHYKIKTDGTWAGRVVMNRNRFYRFNSATSAANGAQRQSVIGLNPTAADVVPVLEAYDTYFEDVQDDAMAFLYDPPAHWAKFDDCGAFPCTAPWNVLFQFKRTTFGGVRPSSAKADFQLIADNDGFAPYVPDCSRFETPNYYMCEQRYLGMLMFESEDADKRDRSLQPIYMQLQGTNMNSKLNSFMDHIWDGFYTG